MERDVAKFAMGTLAVVALFDVATHGQGVAQAVGAIGKVWVNLLAVLSGQKPLA